MLHLKQVDHDDSSTTSSRSARADSYPNSPPPDYVPMTYNELLKTNHLYDAISSDDTGPEQENGSEKGSKRGWGEASKPFKKRFKETNLTSSPNQTNDIHGLHDGVETWKPFDCECHKDVMAGRMRKFKRWQELEGHVLNLLDDIMEHPERGRAFIPQAVQIVQDVRTSDIADIKKEELYQALAQAEALSYEPLFEEQPSPPAGFMEIRRKVRQLSSQLLTEQDVRKVDELNQSHWGPHEVLDGLLKPIKYMVHPDFMPTIIRGFCEANQKQKLSKGKTQHKRIGQVIDLDEWEQHAAYIATASATHVLDTSSDDSDDCDDYVTLDGQSIHSLDSSSITTWSAVIGPPKAQSTPIRSSTPEPTDIPLTPPGTPPVIPQDWLDSVLRPNQSIELIYPTQQLRDEFRNRIPTPAPETFIAGAGDLRHRDPESETAHLCCGLWRPKTPRVGNGTPYPYVGDEPVKYMDRVPTPWPYGDRAKKGYVDWPPAPEHQSWRASQGQRLFRQVRDAMPGPTEVEPLRPNRLQ